MSVIYELNDNNVWIEGLLDDITRTFVNDSTMTATLYDANDIPVSGATAVSMTYLPSSNGRYYATFPYTIANREPDQGTLIVQSSNYGDRWERVVTTRKRR
jgi:hypothetical protein